MTKKELMEYAVRSSQEIDTSVQRALLSGATPEEATLHKLISITQLNAALIGAIIEKLPDDEPKIELAS